MLKNKLKNYMAKHEDGFTIIEVIIVLVIGAVIMLAVFLVVPQLQRTQRNASRQNDARRVLTAVEQFSANNQGSLANLDPNAQAQITQITGELKDPSGNTLYDITNDSNATGENLSQNNILIVPGKSCDGQIAGGTGSAAVVVYQETGGGSSGTTYCVSN